MTARDRRFVAGALVVSIAAAPPAILLGRRGAPALRPGCVSVLRAGFMGGQTETHCTNRRTPMGVVRAAR